jgi:AraC-like DNA-binding protein
MFRGSTGRVMGCTLGAPCQPSLVPRGYSACMKRPTLQTRATGSAANRAVEIEIEWPTGQAHGRGGDEARGMKFTVYYGTRRFLLLAPTFVLDRSSDPYRRLSVTVLIACREPFQLETGFDSRLTARAAVIAPKVPRRRIMALNSDLLIFDIPIQSPEHVAIEPSLRGEAVLPLDFERFAHLVPAMTKALAGTASCDEVNALFSSVAEAISGMKPVERALDARVEKAMRLIDDIPLNEVSLDTLAERLHLSPSRLRHLFAEETGSTISHYARWAAVWRGVGLWMQGKPLTDIAHEIGFYDLAHLDHAFVEVFGINPSTIIDRQNVTLVRCG